MTGTFAFGVLGNQLLKQDVRESRGPERGIGHGQGRQTEENDPNQSSAHTRKFIKDVWLIY